MRKYLLIILFSLILFQPVLADQNPAPLWSKTGIIVNDTVGNTTQQRPVIAKISSSEYMMVWEDFRSGNSDLYLQKIDENGTRSFNKNGIPICISVNEQIYPKIVADGAGGAYITWQDNRTGVFNIYVQRVDSNGNILFAANGIPIFFSADAQVFPEMINDGQGGAIIAWHDYRAKEEDIYAQRIDAKGNVLWDPTGAPVCREIGTQWFPKIISDDQGGAFISWADRRGQDFDIFAQHLDYRGKSLWVTNGVPVCQVVGNQENPRLASNGMGGIFISWSDARTDAPGVYIQNISVDGKKLFSDTGIRLSNIFSGPDIPEITPGKNKDAIVIWSDSYAGDPDIYMQKVSYDGNLLWGEESKPLIRARGAQSNAKIFGTGPYFIIWEDSRNSGKQIYVQKINENGDFSFNGDGIQLSLDEKNAQLADLSIGEDGSAIVCFQDDKHGNFDIYSQRIDQYSNRSWGEYGKIINDTPGSVIHQNYKVVSDNRGNLYFAFEDKRSGYSNVYVQKVNTEGMLMWEIDGFAAGEGAFEQLNPDICIDGKGGAFVVWEDYRDTAGSRLFFQHFNVSGKALIGGGSPVTPGAVSFNQKKPKIVYDGAGGALIVFVDNRTVLSVQDIYAQRISPKGECLFTQSGKTVTEGNGTQDDPVIAPQSLIVAWTDYRNGERNSDIYAQKIDLTGKALWAEDGVPICEAPDSQRDPAIVDDRSGGAVIAWTDRGGGSFDIYAQRINSSGNVLWLKDGVPICQAARTQQRPKVAMLSQNDGMVVWEDFRYGNWDIIGQTFNSSGRVGASEEGISVSAAANTQYNPDIISLGKNYVIAWEDYRNNSTYSIYMQAFDSDGQRLWDQDGVLAQETIYGAREPRLVSAGMNDFALTWEDHRNDHHSIAAQKFKF